MLVIVIQKCGWWRLDTRSPNIDADHTGSCSGATLDSRAALWPNSQRLLPPNVQPAAVEPQQMNLEEDFALASRPPKKEKNKLPLDWI